VARIGAEIVFADARHRSEVDARLRSERPHADGDVVGEAERRRTGDRLDLRDAVDAQIGGLESTIFQPRSFVTRSASW